MERVLKTYPTGIVACVSDSYNIFRACSEYWGTKLKELVLSRPSEPGNQLVIRPDSGDVRTLIEIFTILLINLVIQQMKKVISITTTSKGYSR
jgi:nicotinamide phosphoribosyltransferase